MSDLIYDFIAVGDDGVQLLKSLQALVEVIKPFVYKSQIVDGLNAISLDSNSFEIKLFGLVVLFLVEEAVSFVDQCFRIIPIMLDGQVCEHLSILKILFEEVQE